MNDNPSTVGQVYNKYAFAWVIDNWPTVMAEVKTDDTDKKCIFSPLFSTITDDNTIKWQLQFNLEGCKGDKANRAIVPKISAASVKIITDHKCKNCCCTAVINVIMQDKKGTYSECGMSVVLKSQSKLKLLNKDFDLCKKVILECSLRFEDDDCKDYANTLTKIQETAIEERLQGYNLKFRSLMNDSIYNADVIIKVKDSSKTFEGHKFILAVKCPSLIAQLTECRHDRGMSVINFDIDYETAEEMLRYIYTGEVKLRDKDISFSYKLFNASDNYDLKELQHLCEENIKQCINSTNIFDVLKEIGDNAKAKNIKEFAINYIVQNADTIIRRKK